MLRLILKDLQSYQETILYRFCDTFRCAKPCFGKGTPIQKLQNTSPPKSPSPKGEGDCYSVLNLINLNFAFVSNLRISDFEF